MKNFTTQEIIDLFNRVMVEEISFTRMVEILNGRVSEMEKRCVEDIPVRKFQKGDKVRIKEGISSKTHCYITPGFKDGMNDFIGETMTVSGYTHGSGYVVCNESGYRFLEEWLEPYEELKKGDLAIFWDDYKEFATIRIYDRLNGSEGEYFRHKDHIGVNWKNAIKLESKEQFKRFINGEL